MVEPSSLSSLASMIDLKNFLEYSICAGAFDDPRALPCLHPFCCGCLENWAKACSKDGKIVSCPLCKKVYQVPEDDGIKGFPAYFLVADLQSTVDKVKQSNSTPDVCRNHGEKNIYYCQNCDCAACSDCSALDPTHQGHTFIQLKQAALQQSRSLEDLTGQVRDVESKFVTAVQQAQKLKQDLDKAVDAKVKAVKQARNEHVAEVDNQVAEFQQKIHSRGDEQTQATDEMKEKLQSNLDTIRSTCELATNVAESGSESDIISLYPSLSSSLQQLIQSQPSTVDSTLGQIQLEPTHQQTIASWEQLLHDKLYITTPPGQNDHASNQTHPPANSAAIAMQPSPTSFASSSAKQSPTSHERIKPTLSVTKMESGKDLTLGNQDSKSVQGSGFSKSASFQPAPSSLPRKTWKESGEINTAPKAIYPCGIATHPNGDIAVISNFAPVTVFFQNGDFKHVIKGSPSGIYDIAITPSNQYIIPGKDDSSEFYIYNDAGVLGKTIKSKSSPDSVAVDSTGRIIAGLYPDKTVCIHQPDGTLISKFQTQSSPWQLTCTSDDRLIISFADNTLQVMDQSGHNASIIQPPPGIQSWVPWKVCCSKQGELFVGSWGDSMAVYRYVCTGGEYKYLDCITEMGSNPNGIALSADEEKLYVVDCDYSAIEIFQ